MKIKYILTIAFVLFSTLAINAQPYQSVFSSDTTKWTLYWCTIDATEYYTLFVTNNDTATIDGVTYRITYFYNVCRPQQVAICGYMREDTITGKLWIKDEYENGQEFLAMDLSLHKGDDFSMENAPFDYIYTHITVDSVYYEYGKKTIKFKNIDGCLTNGELFFIEGIGPGYGLYPWPSNFPNALLFKHHNDSLVFTSPNYEEFSKSYMYCENSIKDNSLEPLFEIRSVKNTTVELYIGEKNKQTKLAVFDFSGRLILHQALFEGNNIIELNNKGEYIFLVKNCCKTKTIKINL